MKTIRNLFLATVLIISVNLIAGATNENSKMISKPDAAVKQGTYFQDETELKERANKTLEKAVKALEDIMEGYESSIPVSMLQKAEGIVIIPGTVKIAVGVLGGQGGRGIALIHKEDGSWSNPFFVILGEGSLGFQLGAQISDIVLLFKDQDDILAIEKAEITLGADVGVTAGPESKGSTANTDIEFDAEIYSYYRSKGLFAGVSIKGGVLKYNNNLNNAFYGKDEITTNGIFNEVETPFNEKVNDFVQTLIKYSK
ncbi:MAG: lipid-binding SYLF domain-containing protein [Bacteroidetes bacterium]|nr:lipid-binding SYLF domain-containing protein [Bacteroidota bacterium]